MVPTCRLLRAKQVLFINISYQQLPTALLDDGTKIVRKHEPFPFLGTGRGEGVKREGNGRSNFLPAVY